MSQKTPNPASEDFAQTLLKLVPKDMAAHLISSANVFVVYASAEVMAADKNYTPCDGAPRKVLLDQDAIESIIRHAYQFGVLVAFRSLDTALALSKLPPKYTNN